MPISPERLADIFVRLCETDSPSFKEGRLAALLKEIFTELKADSIEDDGSAIRTGSDCGNLIVRFSGSDLVNQPVFFNCHMDTVRPGEGVRVLRQDSIFSSAGDTVLGGDDKSGIAILIEAMRAIREDGIPHCPVEFIFTTGEEIGLLGAKALDHSRIRARYGYALDMDSTDNVITRAPAANRLIVTITGISAHAGLNPEQGVNAIQLMAKALAGLRLGRLDEESTANFGVISGGEATNIIPARVRVDGEVRSHNEAKLDSYTQEIKEAFSRVVDGWSDPAGLALGRPSLRLDISREYPAMHLNPDCPVIKRVQSAALHLQRTMQPLQTGGGSDANIFNGYGLETAIIGTGMKKVHSTQEYIDLKDMLKTTELIKSILTTA
ncbi:MAG: peptidase M20 [Deltaproteobacteria bacterium RIFOXYD12_FULL_50_9]|nr:MAG: peptidase M20 [Deltaproteobacteria bacterium RIFOXYD12_FULL_50_9]